MMQKLVKCALVGGIVLFLWGVVSYTILPWHKMHTHRFSDEGEVSRVIVNNAPESGVYMVPNMEKMERGSPELLKAKEQMREGPVVFATVCLHGEKVGLGVRLVQTFILNAVLAFIVSWLLFHSRLTAFKKQVWFVTVAGFFFSLAVLSQVIWMGFPMGFAVACIVDRVIGWFLAGLAIVKVLK